MFFISTPKHVWNSHTNAFNWSWCSNYVVSLGCLWLNRLQHLLSNKCCTMLDRVSASSCSAYLTIHEIFQILKIALIFCFARKVCTGLVYGAIFFLVFFYLPPISFVSSLIALDNIAKVVPFLEPGKLDRNFGRILRDKQRHLEATT